MFNYPMLKMYLPFFYLFLWTTFVVADPSKPSVIRAPNSKCIVKSTGGEYPTYKVLKGKQTIYSPKSDGVSNVVFSHSGKYIALSGGEVSLLDISPGKFKFGIVIVNCETAKVRGYYENKPTLVKAWWPGDKGLDLWEGLNLSSGTNSLP